MKKRILAWIALILFLALFVNVLFIHYRVTESLTILMLYALFFFFYKKRMDNEDNCSESDKDGNEPDEPGMLDDNIPESRKE